MHQWMRSALLQIIAWRRISTNANAITNAGLLLIGPLGTNFSETFIKIQKFSFTKMHLKRSSAKWQPFCPGGYELNDPNLVIIVLINTQQCQTISGHSAEWFLFIYYTPRTTKLLGGILVSLRPSVRPSICPACRVRSVTSTVLDGFFPY